MERPAEHWFYEAQRCYLEKHQGCAWCGGSHRVFHTINDGQLIFYCNGCDFHVGHDQHDGRFFVIPGEEQKERPVTMYQI